MLIIKTGLEILSAITMKSILIYDKLKRFRLICWQLNPEEGGRMVPQNASNYCRNSLRYFQESNILQVRNVTPTVHGNPTLIRNFILMIKITDTVWKAKQKCRYIWRVSSSRMLHRVVPVRTDVSEERISIIRVKRITEPGTLPVTSQLQSS
jgi:hypothetical protein